MKLQQPRRFECELAVIGTGLAGMAASCFALRRGLRTAQAGNTGAIAYTTGYFDLLGQLHGRVLSDPWQGLDELAREEPEHPLVRVSREDTRTAFSEFVDAVSAMGVAYSRPQASNLLALTPAGTTKPTLCVPDTMLAGVDAMLKGRPTCIVDFAGMQGFSAREVVANLKSRWPQLSAVNVDYPQPRPEMRVFPEVIARMLEVPGHRAELADTLRAVVGDAEAMGLPAILGIYHPDKVHAELQALVGVPLFEIPTMPPGVPGIRLREMFQQQLPEQGITLIPQQKVKQLELNTDGVVLHLKDSFGDVRIDAGYALLATGRFLSGGLTADRQGVREMLLNLPVTQPQQRELWYHHDYFDPRGHPINRAGVQVDDYFRPLDSTGEPISERLYAAGVVLAHQDWVRQRCGAGVAIASAWKAIESVAACLKTPAMTPPVLNSGTD